MQTEKCQPSCQWIMLEMRFIEFPALSVDPRVGISRSANLPRVVISRSASKTNDFFLIYNWKNQSCYKNIYMTW